MSDSTADTALPPFLRQFFWDTDFDQLRLPAQEFYGVERLLEHGDDAAIRWLRQTFSAENIARVVRESCAISRKTAGFWSLILGIPRDEIRCFSTPSLLQHGSFSAR